jgi:hypothetical protein
MAGGPIVRASNIRMSRNQPAPCRSHQLPRSRQNWLGAKNGPQTVTAYYHLGWWSIIGYAIVAIIAIIAVAGYALAFRDLS